MWNGTFAAFGKGTDTKKKRDDYWLAKAVTAYEADHGGTITVNSTLDGPDLITKVRTSGVAHTGPDLATIWSGTYLLSIKDFLTPLDDYYPKDKRGEIAGWEAVSDDLTDGKTLYGVPAGTDSLTCLFYNKKVLDRAGVDVDVDSVQEWDQFMNMLDKIKSTGVTPLALYDTSYLYFTLMYWIAQNVGGTPGIVELGSGKRQFSSPEVKQAVDGWLSLVPYTNKGAPVLTGDDALKLILTGKAGVASGVGLPDLRGGLGNDVAMTKLPNISPDAPVRDSGIGGPGQSFVIPTSSKHVEETVAFINFLNSKPQQIARAKLDEGPLPNVPGLADLKVYKDPLQQKLAEWSADKFIFWPDNTLDADLISYLAAQTQLAWNGNIDVAEFLGRLDNKRDQIANGG